MVRLKQLQQFQSYQSLSNFNSIMVRLKQFMQNTNATFNAFQFHYGTIKTSMLKNEIAAGKISIPLWYD